MEEQLQPQSVQTRGVSAIHVVLVILMLVTLGGVGYVGWMLQVQSDVMVEKAATADEETAQLRSELAESQAMLAEEKTKAPTSEYHVLLEDKVRGYRVVVAPGCKEFYALRAQSTNAAQTGTVAAWEIILKGSPDGLLGRYLLMTQEGFRDLIRTRAQSEMPDGNIEAVLSTKDGTEVLVHEFGGGDFGIPRTTDGTVCVQPIVHQLP